jgi:3-phenylpropionate/trans-cinnamate dioxygenase ferredoxin subunit
MCPFTRVARFADVREGELKKNTAGGREILIAKVSGRIYATDPVCPHLEADLSKGTLSGTILTCPMHGSQFDLRDGRVVRWTDLTGIILQNARKSRPPRPLKCYPVIIEDDTVLVDLG